MFFISFTIILLLTFILLINTQSSKAYLQQTLLDSKQEKYLCTMQVDVDNWRSKWCEYLSNSQLFQFDECYHKCLEDSIDIETQSGNKISNNLKLNSLSKKLLITDKVATNCAVICFDNISSF